MKRILFAFFVIISFSAYAQRTIDVLNYKFRIELNDRNDSIHGSATILLRCEQTVSTIDLDLAWNETEKKGMKVVQIMNVSGGAGNSLVSSITFKQENNKLKLSPGKKLNAGDTASFWIIYNGVPTDGLIISKSKFGSRTFFADNWPNRAKNWIPCVDDPADKAAVQFDVIAPNHYQVISNGLLLEESNLANNTKLTSWKEDKPIPTKVMVIGVADFAVNYAGLIDGCIPVSSWVYPENRNDGFITYSEAVEILNWLINYIGPFPYQKLANVQSKTIFGGMENASAIFYSEGSVSGKKTQASLLAHEIAHQWFGNTATEKSFAHLWLSEGFATYFTHLYMESRYGADSLAKRMQKDRDEVLGFVKTSHRPVVDNNPDYMQLLNENSYQKGGWILHMLRHELGDDVFQKSIRKYYSAYAWKNADSKDLQKVFEEVSGKKLDVFFNQWLNRPMNPQLKISWKWLEAKKQVAVTVEQLQEQLFSFPLDILVKDKTAEHLQVHNKTETFNISFSKKPSQLIVDPFTVLLAEFSVQETK